MAKKQHCDTCGKEVETLRRDVVDTGYNALNKEPLWNCEDWLPRKAVPTTGAKGRRATGALRLGIRASRRTLMAK